MSLLSKPLSFECSAVSRIKEAKLVLVFVYSECISVMSIRCKAYSHIMILIFLSILCINAHNFGK